MRKLLLLALLGFGIEALADEVTFTFLNMDNAVFSANSAGLAFGSAENVLVTDNTNGKSITLVSVDSGFTGGATDFLSGPPLIADYSGAGANSVLVETGSHIYLTGEMENEGRLEAQYPDRAGAFLSRFMVEAVDPAILTALGTSTSFKPEGSVSLTLAETNLIGGTLHASLGGGEYTIETEAVTVVPEAATLFLYGTGMTVAMLGIRRYWS